MRKIISLFLVINLVALIQCNFDDTILRRNSNHSTLSRSKRQATCNNYCGAGQCVQTTHPTYQYACMCNDGSYKFQPCSSNYCFIKICPYYHWINLKFVKLLYPDVHQVHVNKIYASTHQTHLRVIRANVV
jgi:hypothetical protein